MLNIFNLIENFLDIINDKHYLITCAKYYSSNVNNAGTIYPAEIVGLLQKSYSWPYSFWKRKQFFMAFV